mmetsp:Transcript_8010/g.11581  ORF Transcript_8010/g.11581 Transcript_8010/m.11581 type:complete len:390 (+) Transcript_8010:134-1303(+)|eukprot:CAMPEP_0194252970 /NCGR_PEP_ID=MMETSP0158-20130606/28845_1 /TAXON_ID=33649 /ORGANISM="Thalassionema nitzschioides, Strain L26-B" /LENGTH=389 /DNA_ID=CAMNT_0038990529 /DNA_START=57 /DNA_END=1226 /DNA_ORIENTATION=+
MKNIVLLFLTLLVGNIRISTAAFTKITYSHTSRLQQQQIQQDFLRQGFYWRNSILLAERQPDFEENGCFNPQLRRVMAGVASLGALETAYLTWNKLSESPNEIDLCNTLGGSCSDVLNGPYSLVPSTNIPLSAIGLLAYTMTALVAAAPLIGMLDVEKEKAENGNRILLLMLGTGLGTFSVFLMSLLYGVLHQSCLYCLASATLSITLCSCVWLGGVLPENDENNEATISTTTDSVTNPQFPRSRALQAGMYSFLASVVASILLFASVDDSFAETTSASEKSAPPQITTHSSAQAVKVGKELKALNAQMYGAFWCSHCYDQKQTLGQEAFTSSVAYIECAKDGVDSQSQLCKEQGIPGYPTWVIGGQQFPGESDLEELQEIIQKVKGSK